MIYKMNPSFSYWIFLASFRKYENSSYSSTQILSVIELLIVWMFKLQFYMLPNFNLKCNLNFKFLSLRVRRSHL